MVTEYTRTKQPTNQPTELRQLLLAQWTSGHLHRYVFAV